MAAPKSARNLASGSGTVSAAINTKLLTFSATQYFKEGATIKVTISSIDYVFTIDVGADKTWEVLQNIPVAIPGGTSFTATDTGTTRARGSSGVVVPGAMHFVYRAVNDDTGSPDWYFYFDTIFPENGVHPYTRDQYTGQSWLGSYRPGNVGPAAIPNLGIRIRIIEGILRGDAQFYTAGGTTVPDARLADMQARLAALEAWAQRVGTNTPPAVGCQSGAAASVVAPGGTAGYYTQDLLQSFGDIA
jgi:hypothetical protein